MFSIFKKNRSLRKSVRSVNAPIYYINEKPVYQTPSDDELFENIYGDALEVDDMTVMKAREGNEKDLLKIGYVYYSRHTRNDYLKALDWFMKSAEKNCAEAEFRIAELYYKGQGVEEDHRKSIEWCLRAARKGYIDALNKMGWSYLEGWGVKTDKKRAIYWFTKAADQGDWIAQEQLDSFRDDDTSFSDDVNMEFTDDDFGLDDPLEEKEEEEEEVVDLPMEMPEDKTAELKEIMLKYAKLQKELEDEKQRRDEEIAKRDEEMKDMAKAIEVLQSSMSEAAIDGDDQTLISSTSNSVHKPVTSSSIGKPTLNGYSLENSASYNNPDTPYDGIVRNSKRTYCESPLEDTSDCKSEDGQDPNYNSPEDDDDDDDKGQDLNYDSPNDEEEEEEEQDLNYDSPNDEEEEVEEKEKGKEEEEEEQDLNYDSPDEEPQPNARYNTMPATSEPKSPINRSNTL